MDSAPSAEDELRRLLALTSQLSKSLDDEMKSMPVGSGFLGENDRKLPPIFLARSLEVLRHMKCAIKLMTASKERQELARLPTLVVHEAEKDHKLLHHDEEAYAREGKENTAIESDDENLDGKMLPQHAAADGGAAAGCAKLVRKRKRPLWKQSVHVMGDNPDLADSFIWRKYGEKTIQGATYRRSYYRCTHKAGHGCPAMKHVQKSEDDVLPAGFDVTYIDLHTCGSQPLINSLPFANSAASYNMTNYDHLNPLHDFTTNTHLSTCVASYNHPPSFSTIINDQLIPNVWPLLSNSQPNLMQSNTSTCTASIKTTTIDPSDGINDCMNSSMSYTDHDFLLQTTSSHVISSLSPTNSLVINSTSPASSSEAISSRPPLYQNLHAESEVISFMSNTPTPCFSPSPDLISSNPFAFYDEWQISDKPGQPYK